MASDRERWDAKYSAHLGAGGSHDSNLPAPLWVLGEFEHLLPRSGRALDVAGGRGRHAVWLARRGLQVTLADVSPVGLELARRSAAQAGQSFTTRCLDLQHDRVPGSPWNLVLCTNYLQRDLWPRVLPMLMPGGVAVWVHPTRTNLQRHCQPSARFLLERGEASTIMCRGADLELLWSEQGWVEGPHEEPRHLARVVVRRRN